MHFIIDGVFRRFWRLFCGRIKATLLSFSKQLFAMSTKQDIRYDLTRKMNKIKNKKKEWIRTFEVSEASKISEKGGHFNFQVTSWLFPMGFPEASTKLVTTKKYSDFQKLHKQLSQIHRNLYLSGTMPNLPNL